MFVRCTYPLENEVQDAAFRRNIAAEYNIALSFDDIYCSAEMTRLYISGSRSNDLPVNGVICVLSCWPVPLGQT